MDIDACGGSQVCRRQNGLHEIVLQKLIKMCGWISRHGGDCWELCQVPIGITNTNKETLCMRIFSLQVQMTNFNDELETKSSLDHMRDMMP